MWNISLHEVASSTILSMKLDLPGEILFFNLLIFTVTLLLVLLLYNLLPLTVQQTNMDKYG